MLRSDQYALITVSNDEIVKRYPIDSMKSVMDSYLDFNTDHTLDADERATAGYFLKNAADLFGMALPFEKTAGCMKHDGAPSNIVKKKMVKAATPLPQYKCFALKDRYPIDDAELVKKASQYFEENWLQFDQRTRRVFAKNVQKQASILNCDTSRLIQKFASDSYSNHLQHELNKRAAISGDESFQKLAAYAGKIPVDQFAEIMADLDAKNHIKSSYNKSILDPMTSVLADPMEKRAASGQTWELDGITYSEEEMRKGLAHPDVISLYGNQLVSQLRSPQTFDELPDADKKVILQYGSVR